MTTKEDVVFLLDTMKTWDLANKKTADVYDNYKAECRKAERKPIEKHDFSKQVCAIFNFRTQNKYCKEEKRAYSCFCR
jgi:hypothetical protein